MPQREIKDEHYVIVISSRKEQDKLQELCFAYGVPPLYPNLFNDGVVHKLWGVSKSGIALVGTIICRNTSKNYIIHNLDEVENLFKSWMEE